MKREINNQEDLAKLLDDLFFEIPPFTVEIKQKSLRSQKQNRALHSYFAHLASMLNAAGLDMKTLLKPEVEIPWSQDSVKEHLWKPIQKAVVQKDKTSDLNADEVNKVYEVLDRHLLDKHSVDVKFPTREPEL